MKKLISFCLIATCHNVMADLPNDYQSTQDLEKQVNFLTGSLLWDTANHKAVSFPKSFVTTNIKYWGEYVCGKNGIDCHVIDIEKTDPYYSGPGDDTVAAGQLQEERIFANYGANIYDSSVWQIALAVAAKNGLLDKDKAIKLIDAQNERLSLTQNRANTNYAYGYEDNSKIIKNPQYNYSFRMYGPNFLLPDPFLNSKNKDYANYVTNTFDAKSPRAKDKKLTWADFKPISGENGWAFLLGSVQAASLLKTGDALKNDRGLNNAIDFLWPLSHMQSKVGAFYYATNGSLGNGGKPVPEGEISTENNASILAGLKLLQRVIQDIPNYQNDPRLFSSVKVIDVMLYGGTTTKGIETAGLIHYFKNEGWDKKNNIFLQGGTYKSGVFTPNKSVFALDVNTWGVSALGPKTVNSFTKNERTAFDIWQESKQRAGYFVDGNLWGVGYTDQRHIDTPVLSGEWTAGAINMVHGLIAYYEQTDKNHSVLSKKELDSLKEDQAQMLAGLLKVRTDNYSNTKGFAVKQPKNEYLEQLPENEEAFLYSDSRYNIPFGWYANPIPSTASTTWGIMLSYWFNPFAYQGSMQSNDFTKSKTVDAARLSTKSPYDVTLVNTLANNTPATYSLKYKNGTQKDYLISANQWKRVNVESVDSVVLGVNEYDEEGNWVRYNYICTTKLDDKALNSILDEDPTDVYIGECKVK